MGSSKETERKKRREAPEADEEEIETETQPVDEGTLDDSDEGTSDDFDEGTLDDFDEGTLDDFDEGTLDDFDEGTLDDFDEGTLDELLGFEINAVDVQFVYIYTILYCWLFPGRMDYNTRAHPLVKEICSGRLHAWCCQLLYQWRHFVLSSGGDTLSSIIRSVVLYRLSFFETGESPGGFNLVSLIR